MTGLAIDSNSAVWLLQSDGVSSYFPANPSQDQQPLQANCTIALGSPGSTRTITVPRLAGARLWFSVDTPLTFLLNRGGGNGPGLVEPSITNPSDASYNVYWDFCEFTYNDFQLFANVTYVDFFCIPVALQLQSTDGSVQNVQGAPANGLDSVCSQLQQQQADDGAPWGSLIVRSPSSGANLRALSPNSGMVLNPSLFQGYWQPYVDDVWAKYSSTATLSLDTQASWGVLPGAVSGGTLNFPGVGSFPQPSARDIFSCSTGAFAQYATNGDEMGNITARLAAAFNRSTLLVNTNQPDGESVADYYQTTPTNHYARILHATNLDHRGYAFPYDDVGPSSGVDQSGAVSSGNPQLFTVFIGGGGSYNGGATYTSKLNLREMARPGRQLVGGRRIRRGLEYAPPPSPVLSPEPLVAEEKAAIAAEEEGRAAAYQSVAAVADLEKGDSGLAVLPSTSEQTLRALVPSSVAARAEALLAGLEAHPLFARAKPIVDLVVRLVVAVMSVSVRALVSRISMLVFLALFYLLLGPLGRVFGQSGDGS